MMKRHHLMLSLLTAGTIMTSCGEIDNGTEMAATTQNQTETADNSYYRTRTFAQPDGSKVLNGTPNQNLRAILKATGPSIITSLGSISISEEQYQEIKTFTDKLVENKTSQKEKYTAIFDWVKNNIKFNNPTNNPESKNYPNDPYDVYINRIAVCQGYSNLEVVMCHTQEIPAMVVNGYINGLGHAWVYACPDNIWMVSDPTNKGSWTIHASSYEHLSPMQTEMDIFKDDHAVYNYYDGCINVKEVTVNASVISIPYSVGGFVISSFNPNIALPKAITEIYLGQNITTMGNSGNMSLVTMNVGRNLQAMYVDEKNPVLASHKGIVYKKNGEEKQLYYIPGGMSFIELLPPTDSIIGKNTIANHQNVKEIYFPEGIKRIEAWAIEDCPKLERVYVPEEAEIAENAIAKCPKDVEILRGAPSSIKPVTMD